MVYIGPPPGTTIEGMKARLTVVTAELRRLYAEPGLGQHLHFDADKVASLTYEQHCLMRVLAPEHFRGGWGGRFHRMGCTVQRERQGLGAKCRQARELVDLMEVVRRPDAPSVLPENKRASLPLGPDRIVRGPGMRSRW